MRFLDFCVEQFGVLDDLELRNLSQGLTVIYGGSGTGKTTLVHFLRGVLFGYTAEHQAFQVDDGRYGGSVSLESRGRSLRLTRERSHGVSTELSAVDLVTGIPVTVRNGDLPEWANENTYREVFSVGEQEAVRFDLLTRLCLDNSGVSTDEEIRRAQKAIMQSVQEREGDGVNSGLRQRISELQGHREELTDELARMRRVAPEIPEQIPEQISRAEAELRGLRDSATHLGLRTHEVCAEVERLETLLDRLMKSNIVELPTQSITDRISELVTRQQRWTDIRDAVQREVEQLTTEATAPLQCQDSLVSVLAIVSRLEQRMGATDFGVDLKVADEELLADNIRSEVFSLCDYVARHASAVASHQTSLESILGQRTLHDIQHLDAVLQGQIDALREELDRSADVLALSGKYDSSCDSDTHARYRANDAGHAICGSIVEVEAALSRERQVLDDLRREQRQISSDVDRHEDYQSALQETLKSSARLQDLDGIKGQIAETDAQLQLLTDRCRVLEETESNLQAVIERLGLFPAHSVLDVASEYIARLTEGECCRLSADPTGTTILAATQQSTDLQTLQQLSRGNRDLVALALRLALLQHRAEDSERVPLLLDDVFIMTDDDRASAAADLLMEVAAGGQQIIFFTCQREVCDLLAQKNASIQHLVAEESAVTPEIVQPPVSVAAYVPPQPSVVEMAAPTETTNWLFYLEVDSSVEDLSGLTVAELEAIRASGISHIGELLSLSVEDQEQRYRDRGYSISTDRIRAWRGQAELSTLIPMLRRSDAELLYASGIQSTVELSRMRPETVYEMVAAFQQSPGGARYCRSGRTLDRQQAISWSRWSQHSRLLADARRARSRFFVDSSESGGDQLLESAVAGTSGLRRRPSLSGDQNTTRRAKRPGLSDDERRLREQRQRRRRQRMARHSASYRTLQGGNREDVAGTPDLTFHLNRSADVEAAPSIGPRTAERLATVGVYTVNDLLNASADSVAERLGNRRVSGDTVAQWQSQARLVCMVPGLRGHDSQILVACGINEVDKLSEKRPVDLFALVGPFSETSEGERIIRGRRKPDLEEVTDWVSWAQQSRTLKAAA
jgi:energy-coupling factor transporter ATP-binding protein EcfA2